METSPLICRANQWTDFYMMTASVMKEFKVWWKQKNVDIIYYKLMSKNQMSNVKDLMKIDIDRDGLHIFWTTCGIIVKFSGKTCLMIIWKVTKNQVFILSLEDTFSEKPQVGGGFDPLLAPAFFLFNGLDTK